MTMVGPFLSAALCVFALVLSLRSGWQYGAGNALGLAAGSVSVVAMSLCLVLAARPRFLEPFFGGLDRMYLAHKWFGLTALGAMVLHDAAEPDFERWVRESLAGEFAESLGEVAFYALIGLILVSWIKRIPVLGFEIPYHLWWFSHRVTGAFFALAVFHLLLVDTPLGRGDPLMVFLSVAGGIGIGSYLFIEFLARAWRRRPYTVAAIERSAGATALALSPAGKAMHWRPGQFAFLSIPGSSLGEAHPFTIAGPCEPGSDLRFAIKPLGDWTRRLPDVLQPGMAVEVEGPYGRFDFRKGGARQIWIAGGVGITPFLAWVRSLPEDGSRRVHLFYSVRRPEEAIGLDVFADAAAHLPGFSFDLVVTARDGRLDADRVLGRAPFGVADADLYFCGPTELRRSVLRGLGARGGRPRRVFFELFEFR